MVLILSFVSYFLLLFLIAFYAERRSIDGKGIVNNPYFYALSLAVYCTAWTYFGSVGRAATNGWDFLPIYLGPTIIAPLWLFFLKKIITISKFQRINSIADFVSARYGKSVWLGVLATIIAVFGVIPYVSIQLKGIAFCFDILMQDQKLTFINKDFLPFYNDSALVIAIALAVFTILFGTRKVDPNEQHQGLVAAIAFESIFKLVAFLAAGFYITYGIHSGFGDLFQKASKIPEIAHILDFSKSETTGENWFFLTLLSSLAVIFLPRQFHLAVVENTNPNFVAKAAWLFPLYLFLINIFVIPIAIAGLIQYPNGTVEADTFVLQLPLDMGKNMLAIFIALGGVSAAASMVIVAVTSLTIMISNNLLLPLLVRSRTATDPNIYDFNQRILGIRRVGIILILLLAYGYYRSVAQDYTIVSIGLISFAAVAQLAPIIFFGIYWKKGTRLGALAGLLIGFSVWGFTLALPNLAEAGIISSQFIEKGLFGLSLLKPYELFGLTGMDHISHGTFWSLILNIGGYYFVSIYSQQSAIEIQQADLFVDIHKYKNQNQDYELLQRNANWQDLKTLFYRYLGEKKATQLIKKFEKKNKTSLTNLETAPTDLVNFVETNLAGALGAASAKIVINSIVKVDPISLDEMLTVLDQTQEIIQYSRQLEVNRAELEATTLKLQIANDQLKELDELKAEFISSVTHELRTPITAIKSLAKIIHENPTLPLTEKNKFIEIIVTESERLARLVNQVLDIEKLQSKSSINLEKQTIDLNEICHQVWSSVQPLILEKKIISDFNIKGKNFKIFANADQIIQILINILSNAIKFCDPQNGKLNFSLTEKSETIQIAIMDNGKGIPKEKLDFIFEKFTQIHKKESGKPSGSGLGLFITKKLVNDNHGKIYVDSKISTGTTFVVEFPKLEKKRTF